MSKLKKKSYIRTDIRHILTMKMTTNFWKGLLVACFLVGKVSAQEHSTGCVLNAKLYEKVPLAMPLARGDYEDLPASHSLRKYAPTPQNQGSYGTCVGWAIAYSARTIQMAHQQNWTNTVLITENALSPFFVYESAKPSSDIHCMEGTSLYNGLEILKDLGSVKVFDYPHQCGRTISKNLENKAQNFKIKDYRRLFETGVKDKIPFVKKSIAENRPVVIGMQCCMESFQDAKGQKFWKATTTETEKPQGGHALTVVAYHDDYEGTGEGAVELMNSWGTAWGDGGFIWMSYTDFNTYCFEAYQMTIQQTEVNELSGKLKFELSAGENMPFYFKNGVYESKETYKSGTMFRLSLTNHESMYVYAIGSDLLNQDYKIFPASTKISSLVDYKNSKIVLPSEKNYIQMDTTVGTDYICLLYSVEDLGIEYVLNILKTETGTLPERIQKVFGERLFNPTDIDRSQNKNEISFKANSKNRTIVPVYVAIQHID